MIITAWWSFGPNSALSSIERTTSGKTHPNLHYSNCKMQYNLKMALFHGKKWKHLEFYDDQFYEITLFQPKYCCWYKNDAINFSYPSSTSQKTLDRIPKLEVLKISDRSGPGPTEFWKFVTRPENYENLGPGRTRQLPDYNYYPWVIIWPWLIIWKKKLCNSFNED